MRSPLTRIATALAGVVAVGSAVLVAPSAPASAVTVAATTPTAVTTTVSTGARDTRVSRSLSGVRSSAYIGRHFDRRYEATRRCIVRKESGGNYRIVSSGGSYRGAYQFNSYLARATAKKMGRPRLASKPMNQWSRFAQDKAFWVVWNHGKGARNWPTRYGC